MAYTPYYSGGWQSGEEGNTPITPAALNNMENGIEAANAIGDPVAIAHGGTGATTIEGAKANMWLGVSGQNLAINGGGTQQNWAMQIGGNVINTNCDWEGNRILIVIHEKRGIYIYDNTNNEVLYSQYNVKTVTGTTTANGNINLNLDPHKVVVYQVYSRTADQIVSVSASGGSSGINNLYAHVTTLGGAVVANTNVSLVVVYGIIPSGIIEFE